MFLGNIILLGYQGAGKTSLLHSLTGEAFRLVEPPSQRIDIADNYCSLTDNLSWVSSVVGLAYEDELVRLILDDLLRHMNSSPSKGMSGGLLEGAGGGGTEGTPPLPQRSHSFSEAGSMCVNGSATNGRFSGSFEYFDSTSAEAQWQKRPSVDLLHSAKGKKHHRFAKFLNKSFGPHHQHHKKEHAKVKRHFSDSTKHMVYASQHTPSPPMPPHSSPLPERLVEMIKGEFFECMGNTLPPRYLARLIDTPGHPSFRVLQSLFLTENSLCLLVFDASRDILSSSLSLKRKPSPEAARKTSNDRRRQPTCLDDSCLLHIMAEISNICVQWSGCNLDVTVCGPRIIVVGTHSDKVSSSVAHRNFEILRDEIKASPYQKYVAAVKFVISNSSIIERSSMDDLKRFVKENIKKSCRQQVPLKWLRCVRRFQAFLKKRNYFVSLTDAKKLVSEICDISLSDPEIGEVIEFLHRNQVVMHFSRVHHLRDLVISSAQWFLQQVSALFGAALVDIARELGPQELVADQELLRSTGVFSNRLLDYTWRGKDSKSNKEKVLTVMNKMDLLCFLSSDAHPSPLSASSVEDLTAEPKKHHHVSAMPSLVVPALVEEPDPPVITSLPAYNVDPMLFRFKDHVPNGLFSRVLVRCVQSYPQGFVLYRHSATFQVDEKSLLLLREDRNSIRLSLHPLDKATPTSPSSQQLTTSLDSIFSDSAVCVNPFVCMAVLMFVQASISDLTQQWTPHLDFDLCVECSCKMHPIPMDSVVDIDAALAEISRNAPSRLALSSDQHYIILNDVDSLLQHLSLRCELGNRVSIGASLMCWFGEQPAVSVSPTSPLWDVGE